MSQITVFLLRLLFWVLHKHRKYHGFGSILGLGVDFLWGRKIDHFLSHKNCHTSTHPQPLHIPFPCPYLVPGSIAGFAKPNNISVCVCVWFQRCLHDRSFTGCLSRTWRSGSQIGIAFSCERSKATSASRAASI